MDFRYINLSLNPSVTSSRQCAGRKSPSENQRSKRIRVSRPTYRRSSASPATSLSSPALAAALGMPRDQAAKVLQSLNNARLVQSIRSRRGGYVLMKQLDEISVIEVLDALNPREDSERLRPKTCMCDPTRMCRAHRSLRRLNGRVRQALAGESVARLVRSDLGASSREPRAELLCVTLRRK